MPRRPRNLHKATGLHLALAVFRSMKYPDMWPIALSRIEARLQDVEREHKELMILRRMVQQRIDMERAHDMERNHGQSGSR